MCVCVCTHARAPVHAVTFIISPIFSPGVLGFLTFMCNNKNFHCSKTLAGQN